MQLPILDSYQNKLASSLDAFESFSSAFVRAVPGAISVGFGGREEGGVSVDYRRLTSGVEGVQRLCKALLSSKYIQKALTGWGEDLVRHFIVRQHIHSSSHLVFPGTVDGNERAAWFA